MRLATLTATVLTAAIALGLGAASAEAKSCKYKKHGCTRDQYARELDRRTASEREWEHTRAKAYDPGGSYEAYPDWARYALSPKGNR